MFVALMFAAIFVQALDSANAEEEKVDGAGVVHAEMQDHAGNKGNQRKSTR